MPNALVAQRDAAIKAGRLGTPSYFPVLAQSPQALAEREAPLALPQVAVGDWRHAAFGS